ncbi:hypothetical protein ACWGCI_10040 [Streptomyces sp. NPDC054949]
MYESYGYPDFQGFPSHPETSAFWGRPEYQQHPSPGQPLDAPGETQTAWDPTTELAHLLQESAALGQSEPFTRIAFGDNGDNGDTTGVIGFVAGPQHTPAERPSTPPAGGHRRNHSKSPVMTLLQTGSLFTAALVAAIATVVSILSGLAICDALRHSAAPQTAREVVHWWPLLIYGPWMVASLSILRSALHQRRALHSWSIVLLFSTLATLLCVAQAPRTIAAAAASALPAVAALACFQQLVRQITLTRPPRQAAPRHRNPSAPVPAQLKQTTPTAGRSSGRVTPDYHTADSRAVHLPPRGHGFG